MLCLSPIILALTLAAAPAKPEPFAFADFSWIPGNYGPSEHPLSFKAFTGELRVDTAYHYSLNRPQGIEPWLVNGWQSYGKFAKAPGVGLQVLWRPNGWLSILGNQYYGTDTLGNEDRKRVHTDDSVMVKYHDNPSGFISKAAASLTVDAGCESGGGVMCSGSSAATPSQYFLGFMAYNRLWFDHDRYGLTIGGGAINNPGRYLVLMPPINGATAFSGTPYFTYNPGDQFRAWDTQLTFDYMPKPFLTFRSELNHRAANVPYFSGRGGVTPPGGNTGAPGSAVPGWAPDLRKTENRLTFAMLLRF